MIEGYVGIAGLPQRWQSDETLKAVVQAYFMQGASVSQEQLEIIRRYCLSVVKAPCYYKTQAEGEHQVLETRLEEVSTVEALRRWLGDALQSGIDPF